MPIFSYLTLVVVLSSLGLPGLNGFIGESTILFGTLKSTMLGWVFAAFAMIGLILAVIYLLWLFRKVMMGDVTDATARLRDVTGRELAILTPIVALIFLIGLYPLPFFVTMESSVSALIQQFGPLVALR
jgi:NADH-quinone oxidoreductase subunit M